MTQAKPIVRVWFWRVGTAIAIALVIATLLVVPELWRLFPRSTRRPIVEVVLTTLLVMYLAAWIGGIFLTGMGTVSLLRAKQRDRRLFGARLVLGGVSTLIALMLAEMASALWIARQVPQTAVSELVPKNPTALSSDSPIRVVVIGESSARGYPYHPRLSVGQIVAWSLENVLPDRRIGLEILAQGGATLEQMQHALASLPYRPDVLIVYAGHNEFWTRYPATRVVKLGQLDVDALLRRSLVLRILLEARDQNRVDGPQTAAAERRLIDQPAYAPAEYQQRLTDFRRQLTEIVTFCSRQGTLSVLIIPPANDAGYEPNRSILPASLTDSQRAAFEHRFTTARSAESDPPKAIELYRMLIEEQPGFAESHYRLGRLLLDQGDVNRANAEFARARDTDAYAIRCPTAFHDVYRQIAENSGAILIDGPSVLRAVNPHGVLDYNLFHDAHHPSFRGHVALAEAVLRGLRARGALGWTSGAPPTMDREACARQFSIDTPAWNGVCVWAIAALDYGAKQRFDGAPRRAWARRFEQAAHAMAQGIAPEQTGVPGLGITGPWYPPRVSGPGPEVTQPGQRAPVGD